MVSVLGLVLFLEWKSCIGAPLDLSGILKLGKVYLKIVEHLNNFSIRNNVDDFDKNADYKNTAPVKMTSECSDIERLDQYWYMLIEVE